MTDYAEAGVPVKALNPGGFKCGGCGSADYNDDWYTATIEFSEGLRDHRYSKVATITEGFMLCPTCYLSPAAGILRNAVSDVYAKPAPKGYHCITLCTKPYKALVRNKKVPRKTVRCPACFSNARVYRINRDETPGIVARIARAFQGKGKR